MERYMNRYKFSLTGRIIDLLDEYGLVEDVYFQDAGLYNQQMECIKIKTQNFDVDNPCYTKEIYIGCFNDSSFISCLIRMFSNIYSDRVRRGLIQDIENKKESTDNFGIKFISNIMFAEVLYYPPDNIHSLHACINDAEKVAQIAISRMEPCVSRRRGEEERWLRWN